MGKPIIFNGNNAKMLPTGNLLDSTGTIYQRYLNPVYQTSGAIAAVNTHYMCNTTSAGFTMTLPAGAANSIIRFSDDASTWATNNLTIAPHTGETIQGIAGNGSLVCDLSGAFVELAWDSTNSYWVVVTNGFQYGPTYVPGSQAGIVASSGLLGFTNGASIASGYVGQQLSFQGTAVAVSTAGFHTIATLSNIPAGVWLIVVNGIITGASTTSLEFGIATAANSATGYDSTNYVNNTETSSIGASGATGMAMTTFTNISTTTTLYLTGSSFVNTTTASCTVTFLRVA